MRRPKCVKGLKGKHSMIDTKFRIHKILVLSLGNNRTNNFMNNQRLVKTHNVLKYFQPRNVHLAKYTRLQALDHIARCTCLHLALWQNSSYNLDLQITKFILVHIYELW
jgi:hypothetical protein